MLLMLATLVGCAEKDANSTSVDLEFSTDKWLGQWNGPEGTFLRLEGGEGRYQVIIQDLDGPKTFEGRATEDRIQFERNGATESIRATNGAETGMKWLADKSNCLTIRAGEGFCRD